MSQKLKILFYLGPKDGLVQYWDDVIDEFVYFDYINMTHVIVPNFTNNEYHVYRLTAKNNNEYIYGYEGVSRIGIPDESTD